jgi:GNAT superfamily N-acetyltransferase
MPIRLLRIESTDLAICRAELDADVLHEIVDESLPGFCLLARDSAVSVGGLMVERAAAHASRTWWLHNVYVTPARRRLGIFTRLCTHVRYLARTERVERIRVYVQRHNTAALSAFERLGFCDVTALVQHERPNSIVSPAIYRRLGLVEPPLRVLQDNNVDGGREGFSRPPTIRLVPALTALQLPADRSDALYA